MESSVDATEVIKKLQEIVAQQALDIAILRVQLDHAAQEVAPE